MLKAELPREVYARGRGTLFYLMGVLLGLGLLSTALGLVLLEKMVLFPLARLGATVNRIRTSGELSQRVPIQGRDELALLAQDFNAMLEHLERSQAELKRSNQDLEQFASVASHDLQEPLRMVVSYSQLLQRRYQGRLDADADQFIAFTVDGATRMQHLISDLLAYARAGARGQEPQSTDCEAVLRSVQANLEAAVAESQAVITHDPLPRVVADPVQLGQVFQNLLSNALKYRDPQRPPQVHIGARLSDGQWLLSVRDNGIGIAAQHLDRLFGLFQRLHTREEYPGTGIGLALCKRIVERHGGRIWVESQPGVGATFFFTLPTKDGSL